jgi:hypothetical protein
VVKFYNLSVPRSGTSNANKGVLMAAMAYNIKKYMKLTKISAKTAAQYAQKLLVDFFVHLQRLFSPYPSLKF